MCRRTHQGRWSHASLLFPWRVATLSRHAQPRAKMHARGSDLNPPFAQRTNAEITRFPKKKKKKNLKATIGLADLLCTTEQRDVVDSIVSAQKAWLIGRKPTNASKVWGSKLSSPFGKKQQTLSSSPEESRQPDPIFCKKNPMIPCEFSTDLFRALSQREKKKKWKARSATSSGRRTEELRWRDRSQLVDRFMASNLSIASSKPI